MSVFKDETQLYNVFEELMTAVISEEKIKNKFKKTKLSLKFVTSEPESYTWLNHEVVVTGDEAKQDATITMQFPADQAHAFYMKQVSFVDLLSTRKMKVKGMLPKLMALLPLLDLVFEKYPDLCRKHGIIS